MSKTKDREQERLEFARKYVKHSLKGLSKDDLLYIQTYTGRHFYPARPEVKDICIEDIAHGLSLLCRFTGQIKTFYSVAQHSVLVSYRCDPKDAFEGLHHDDTEAYYADINRPLKRSLGMEFYRIYENLGAEAIRKKFGLREEPESVKRADGHLLETEARDLLLTTNSWSGKFGTPLITKIIPWSPEKAEYTFLKRHYELGGK